MKTSLYYIFACSTLLLASNFANADIAIIANKNITANAINQEIVKRLYLGRQSSIDDSTKVTIIGFKEGSTVGNRFNAKVLQKNDSQLASHWARMLFTGQATPPKEAGSRDADMLNEVKRNESAIGYVDAANLDDSVKVLLIIKE
jgi:ABC-type phosphate transport system substrate-binding protein